MFSLEALWPFHDQTKEKKNKEMKSISTNQDLGENDSPVGIYKRKLP